MPSCRAARAGGSPASIKAMAELIVSSSSCGRLASALSGCVLETVASSLGDQPSLKVSDGTEDVEHQFSGGGVVSMRSSRDRRRFPAA